MLNLGHPRVPVGNRLVSLTPTEFSILRILLEQRGKVVSAEALFHAIWADEYYCKSSNTISVHGPPPAGKAGRHGGALKIHQDGLGSGVSN